MNAAFRLESSNPAGRRDPVIGESTYERLFQIPSGASIQNFSGGLPNRPSRTTSCI